MGFSLINLGEAYREMGDYNRAAAFSSQALDELQAINYRTGMAIVLENLASISLSTGEYGRAYEFASRALSLATEIGSPGQLASAHALLGAILAERGELQSAWDQYRRSSELAANLDAPVARIIALAGMAQIAYNRSEPDAQVRAAAIIEPILPLILPGAGRPLADELPSQACLGLHPGFALCRQFARNSTPAYGAKSAARSFQSNI